MTTAALTITMRDLEKLQHDLKWFRKKSVPFAVRDQLNAAAFLSKRVWSNQIDKKLTVRNTWTKRGIRFERATGTKIEAMQSKIGNIRPYMRELELGGTDSDSRGVPIHTSVASGEGRGARPRRRVVRRGNRLDRIRASRGTSRGRTGSKKQRNAIAIAQASRATGVRRFAFISVGGRSLYVKVTGKKRLRISTVIDVSRKTTRVKPHRTLQPTVALVEPRLPELHALAIIRQMRRARILGHK